MFFISPPFGNYIRLDNTMSICGSFTLYPRDGLLRQVLSTLRYMPRYKGWVNKIGLRNKGIDWAIQNYSNDNICSIAIMNSSEIEPFLKKVPTHMNIEINVSCPNVQKQYNNMDSLKMFINKGRKWCIIKLSPHTSFETIDHYYKLGFRQFHCCNTVPVPEGGLSGPAIQPYATKLISYIRCRYPDSEIIAGGGITERKDMDLYRNVGANHFAFSTLLFHPFKFAKFYIQNIIADKSE